MTPLNVTLDTNCLFALEKQEAEADDLKALIAFHNEGRIALSVGLSSALENPGGEEPEEFPALYARMEAIGLGHVSLFTHPEFMPFLVNNTWTYDSRLDALYRRAVHVALSPMVDYMSQDYQKQYCKLRRWNPDDLNQEQQARIRKERLNKLADALGLHSHVTRLGDLFVTIDSDFHNQQSKPKLNALVPGYILKPAEARPGNRAKRKSLRM